MKFKSLHTLLIIVIAILVVIPVVIVSSTAVFKIDDVIDQGSRQQVEASTKTAEVMYDEFKEQALSFAMLIAKREDLAKALYENDRGKMENLMTKEYNDLKEKSPFLKTLELTDSKATVVMRGHNSGKWGDNKKEHPMVAKAMNGEANSGITVSTTTGKVAMDGIAAIKYNGKVVGTIKAGFYTNDNIAKHVKESTKTEVLMFFLLENPKTKKPELKLVGRTIDKIEGKEFTLQEGIEKDEKTHVESKVTHTFLTNQAIIDSVVNGNKHLVQSIEINNSPYMASFSPVLDVKGKVKGVIMLALDQKSILANKHTSTNLFILLGVICTIIGAGIGLMSARSITKPIVELTNLAEQLANGNLTVESAKYKSNDEIGRLASSYNKMLENMRQLIQKTAESAVKVADTSKQLATTSAEASRATQQVASSIEQIASGAQLQTSNVLQTSEIVDQVVKSIQETAASTQSVSVVAQKTSQAANTGGESVKSTIEGMEKIKDKVYETASKIKELGEQSKQISDIVQVIDDIAAQTNLLALNAAIEAARAGDHGKGFAVVADEVKKLAERVTKATKEITNLVTTIQNGTEKAIIAMNEGTNEVETGANLAQHAGASLEEILRNVEETYLQVQNISAVTEEVSAASSEVSDAIKSIADISQENTSAAEEVSSSTQQMTTSTQEIAASAQLLELMAKELQEVVKNFRL